MGRTYTQLGRLGAPRLSSGKVFSLLLEGWAQTSLLIPFLQEAGDGCLVSPTNLANSQGAKGPDPEHTAAPPQSLVELKRAWEM